MIEKKQPKLNNIINQRCYRNQSIKTQIFDLSIAKSIAHQYDHITNRTIHWSFFYLNSLDNCTSQHSFIHLFDNFFQRLHEYFSLQFFFFDEIFVENVCVCQSNRFVLFVSVQKSDSIKSSISFYLFVRQSFSKIVRASFSLQFEIFDQNIRVCKSNRRVFSVFDRKCTSWICIENFRLKQFSFLSRKSNFLFLSFRSLRIYWVSSKQSR